MNPRLPLLFSALGLGFLTGCTPSYQITVDALSDPSFNPAPGTTYRVLPAEGGPEGLRFAETARYVSTLLDESGYLQALPGATPDIEVQVSSDVSEPQVISRKDYEPVYARSSGYSRLVRYPVYKGGQLVGYRTSRVYYPPDTSFAGWVRNDRQVTVYEKRLRLSAQHGQDHPEAGEEVWTLSVSTLSPSSDLRGTLPFLAAAALPYVGAETPGEIVVDIREDDQTVRVLRADQSPAPPRPQPQGTAQPAPQQAPAETTEI